VEEKYGKKTKKLERSGGRGEDTVNTERKEKNTVIKMCTKKGDI
jgi:hypothetical protein